MSEYENSEVDDFYSDSTDFENEGRRSRQRHAKVMYDPKCDQARDALTNNAVLNG